MCYYTETHARCGHAEKLPLRSSQCTCTLNNLKITDSVDATKNGLESKRKYHRKYGNWKGEVQAVKESWCSRCLVEQKAQVYDQVNAGNIGSVLSKAINPGEPQIHPAKTHNKNPKSSTETAQKQEEGTTDVEDRYMVPKWGTEWEDKTRSDMRREIYNGKMDMVDEIRVLRAIVKSNGMTTDELERKIKAQTDKRKAAEQQGRDDAEQKRQARMEKHQAGVDVARLEKARKKAAIQMEHLERLEQRKARVLYRV